MKELDLKPSKVLVVAAHADDNEFCYGGLINKWASAGAEVEYLILTDGQRGSDSSTTDRDELIKTRKQEQHAASEILGVANVHQLEYEDGRLDPTLELKKDITQIIREVKPDTILSFDPSFYYSTRYEYVNHRDHRSAGQATIDAIYPLARDETAFYELEHIEPHTVENLVMYNLSDQEVYVDVADHIDKKIAALKAHASQFGDGDDISAIVNKHAQITGKAAGIELAEGFIHLPIH